jgi:hypothetical protein
MAQCYRKLTDNNQVRVETFFFPLKLAETLVRLTVVSWVSVEKVIIFTVADNFRHAFATMSFIAETFIFLYVGMDALDIDKWAESKAR